MPLRVSRAGGATVKEDDNARAALPRGIFLPKENAPAKRGRSSLGGVVPIPEKRFTTARHAAGFGTAGVTLYVRTVTHYGEVAALGAFIRFIPMNA